MCFRWDSRKKKTTTHIFVLSWYFWLIFPFPLQRRPFDLWWASWLCVFILQILFMNKIDLFQDKILHSGRHLRLYLPQFKGGSRSTRSDRLKTLIAVCIFEIEKRQSVVRGDGAFFFFLAHNRPQWHTHMRAHQLWYLCGISASAQHFTPHVSSQWAQRGLRPLSSHANVNINAKTLRIGVRQQSTRPFHTDLRSDDQSHTAAANLSVLENDHTLVALVSALCVKCLYLISFFFLHRSQYVSL